MNTAPQTEEKNDLGYFRYLLMLGHLCVDINQGALPAILPFLIAAKGLNYASAAALVFASNFVSSIVQPLFGYLGDKASRPWFMCLGLLLAGSGIAMIGFLDEYRLIFFAVMISGLGIAIFHPEGGRMANRVSGKDKSTSMSIFSVGGNLGFAVGPLIVSIAMSGYGIKGSFALMFPAYIMAAVLLIMIRRLPAASLQTSFPLQTSAPLQTETAGQTEAPAPAQKDNWPAFVRLAAFVLCRATVTFGMTTFIPLYWVGVLGQSQSTGSMALSLYSLISAASTLIGGRLADRYGFNKIIRISVSTFVPFLFLFTLVGNLHLATFMLIPMAFALNLCFSTMVTIGQSFLPNHIGFASGVTMGMGISVGGVSAPILGRVSDLYGLTAAFYVIIALACLTALLGYLVPRHQKSN